MFDLTSYLTDRTQLIEQELDKALRSADEKPALLHEAMRYSIFTGGKRLRPILCLAACEMAGGQISDAVPPALAVEIYHTYTLVHDDLPCMDDDDLRRGKPTVHKQYDEATAVLTGDALQAMCFEVLADATPPPPYTMIDMVKEMANAAGSVGVVGGQVEDIACTGKQIDLDSLDFIHRAKTARLFIASVRLGAMAGAADKESLESISSFGEHLGLAFQLADDILDGVQDASNPGRLQGDGNLSCLTIMSADEATHLMKSHLADAERALSSFDATHTAPLINIGRYIDERVAAGQDVPDQKEDS
jgi:geranylgeranyl diphosphate synthase type II